MKVSRKVGRNKGRPRIWIEGKALTESGFDPGDVYFLEITPGKLKLSKTYGQPGVRKVSGKGSTPIVEILGKAIEKAFDPVPEKVQVECKRKGTIHITAEEV